MNIGEIRWLSWRQAAGAILMFLAVALPVVFYLKTYDSAQIKITLMQLGVLAIAAFWLLGGLEEGRWEISARNLPLMKPAALLWLWNAVHFAFSGYRLASLHGFIMQEACLLTFLLTLNIFSSQGLRRAVFAVVGGWLIVVGYGLAQWLSWDPFIWKGSFGTRVFSTLGNPDFLAAYLLVCAPLSLALALDEDIPSLLRAFIAAAAVLAAAVLAWTGSDFEVVLYILCMAAFVFMSYRVLRGRPRSAAAGLTITCAVVCALAFAFSSQRRASDGQRSYRLRYQEKFLSQTWLGTARMIQASPLVGTGPGSFWVHYPAFRRPSIIRMEHIHNSETDHPENELLEQWAEGGLIGAALWLWLFIALLRRGWKALYGGAQPENEIYLLGAFVAMAVSLLSMMITSASRYVAPGWLMYFIAALIGVGCLEEPGGSFLWAFPLPFDLWARRALFAPVLAAVVWLGWYSARMFESEIHHNVGIYYSKNGQWDKALSEYDAEVPGAPAYVMGQYFKGNVLMDSNGVANASKAVVQYDYVRTLAPDYVVIHYQEAKALRQLGRKDEAIAQLEAETAIDSTWDAPWRELSELYQETRQPEKAALAAQKETEAQKQWGN